jgi:hypothetical protein
MGRAASRCRCCGGERLERTGSSVRRRRVGGPPLPRARPALLPTWPGEPRGWWRRWREASDWELRRWGVLLWDRGPSQEGRREGEGGVSCVRLISKIPSESQRIREGLALTRPDRGRTSTT